MQVLRRSLPEPGRYGIVVALIPGCVALSVIAAAGEAFSRKAPDAPPPVVRLLVVNRAHLEAPLLQASENDAGSIYRLAGVQTRWVNVVPGLSDDYAVDFIVVIVTGHESRLMAARLKDEILGFAARDSGIAFVLLDRVEDTASTYHASISRLLGRVIAHEVGHLLLPVDSHSDVGIMQRGVSLQSESLDYFTAVQAKTIRQRVASLAHKQQITSAALPVFPTVSASEGSQPSR
jgi:hypothetical protein